MSLFAICSTLFMFTKLSSSFRVEMELESLDSGRVSDFEGFFIPLRRLKVAILKISHMYLINYVHDATSGIQPPLPENSRHFL